MRYIKENKASLSIEAALILPLFMIGILSITCLIWVYEVNEKVSFDMNNEVRQLSSESLLYEGGLFGNSELMDLSSLIFNNKLNLESKLNKDVGQNKFFKNLKVSQFNYLYEGTVDGSHLSGNNYEVEDLIKLEVTYGLSLPLPINMVKPLTLKEINFARAWTGANERDILFLFSDMEKETNEYVPVFIFPEYGEVYHKSTCSVLEAAAFEQVYTKEIKKIYDPCDLCRPGTLPYGSLVYVFNTGHAFHKPDCGLVQRRAIEIDEKDAINKKYRPCQKCH